VGSGICSLLRVHRDLLTLHRALLIIYRALLTSYRALFGVPVGVVSEWVQKYVPS